MVQYLKFTPPEWPQDQLQVPTASVSQMPPTGRANKQLIRQEATVLTMDFPQTVQFPLQTDGVIRQFVLPTDQDGDFWCDQIFIQLMAGPASQFVVFPSGTLGFADLRTGRSLTFGNTDPPLAFWYNSFVSDPNLVIASGSQPLPFGFRNTGTLPQPFCFTRQGGVIVSLAVQPFAQAFPIFQIVMSGWKEYSYGA